MKWVQGLGALAGVLLAAPFGRTQDLAPRAYVITPINSNALTWSYSYSDGSVFTDPTVPVTDGKAVFHMPSVSYFHSFGLLGRTSSITVALPYVIGNFRGTPLTSTLPAQAHRSGLTDARIRFSMNLKGGPSMKTEEYSRWSEDRLLGFSLTVVPPTGQYDPARLISLGYNRWSIKPEIGYSRHLSNWILDSYAGVWFYTTNNRSYPGDSLLTQKPVYAGEVHLSYAVKPRMWFSFDGNLWVGGLSTVDGVENTEMEINSRVGVTVSVPLKGHWSTKVSYSLGAYSTIGGDFQRVSAALQYSWIGTKWH